MAMSLIGAVQQVLLMAPEVLPGLQLLLVLVELLEEVLGAVVELHVQVLHILNALDSILDHLRSTCPHAILQEGLDELEANFP